MSRTLYMYFVYFCRDQASKHDSERCCEGSYFVSTYNAHVFSFLFWLQARAQLGSLPFHSVHTAVFCGILHIYAFLFRMPVKAKPSKVKPPPNQKQKERQEKALPNYHFHILCVAFVQHSFLYSHPRHSRRLLEHDAANDPERKAGMLPGRPSPMHASRLMLSSLMVSVHSKNGSAMLLLLALIANAHTRFCASRSPARCETAQRLWTCR